ncbi:MAG: tetratricopeptide repeat protein [Gemmataceae bacterium]|nr:tetratricopeptide repeat protein [Gemmataceae bacterium]
MSRPPRSRRAWAWSALALILLGVAVAWRLRDPAPDPPQVPLENIDPSVRAAVTEARLAVTQSPRSAAEWGRFGMVLFAHEFGDAARVALAQAALLDPEEPRWPYLQGRLLYRDPEQALPHLERAVALCHDRPPAPRLKLAETLLELGRLDDAERHFRQALAADPRHPRVHLGLGQLALAREQWPAAVEHLQGCAATPYARQKGFALLAAAYRRIPGRIHDAVRAAARAQQPPPDLSFDQLDDEFIQEVAQLGVGRNHRRAAARNLLTQGRPREAVPLLQSLARDYPDDTLTLVLLAEVLLRGEDWRGAASAAERALRRDPLAAQAHFYLGVARFELAQRQGTAVTAALEPLRRATELKPDHGYAFNYLGRALQRAGRTEEACSAFLNAVRCYPAFVDPHLHLADMWLDSGWATPAFIHLHHAFQVADRNDRRPAYGLARAWLHWSLCGLP